jgi:hypothetical protein
VLFIVDPLDKHPHDPDIQTLLRICNVRNFPLATNIATADVVISSPCSRISVRPASCRRAKSQPDRERLTAILRRPSHTPRSEGSEEFDTCANRV